MLIIYSILYTINLGGMQMNIQEALTIGDLTKSITIAGSEGITREITSIEVMEVPEVVSWVTSGILVMTTFYSIKNDIEKQIEIVQTLIDKNAAGIVIKLGRFVDALPEKMLAIANKENFPIIVIPKNVSYINVLAPLYERLYKEKQLKENSYQPFIDFESKSFASLSKAMEELSEIIGGPLYIEDVQCSLLYCTRKFLPNGWRNSNTLFSKPIHTNYEELSEELKTSLIQTGGTLLKIDGFRNILIMPLLSNKYIFGMLHIPYTEKLEASNSPIENLKEIVEKIEELFMNEQLYLQKKRIEHLKRLEQFNQADEQEFQMKEHFIIRFHASWFEKHDTLTHYVIDYSNIVLKELLFIMEDIPECSFTLFEKHGHYYALVDRAKNEDVSVMKTLEKVIADSIHSLTIAVAPIEKDNRVLADSIRLVDKTMEIGRLIRKKETFYTYDQLGIYEILINLTSQNVVKNYTKSILEPLFVDQNKELLHTLEVYLNENGNVTKASEKLFIHRRTLTFRLQKIQELLQMNIDEAENRFILNFCLRIKSLNR
ncbi:PucR family transcriptional regulator [Sporosarcina sp. P21c]|nr:PucR family transcriptional regulator [Sporosarcina sp. P16a]PIC89110.1 PucR family transcriptional regulator [Sporosarcina sp. P21c]PIC93015.1 PucR family transcriptional regulator [Sporosarcina sp. P25]